MFSTLRLSVKLVRVPVVPLVNNASLRFKKSDCRRAIVEIPPKPLDPTCKKPCRTSKKPLGLLYKLKLKIIEGGTNFGTPFAKLREKFKKVPGDVCEEKTKALAPPKPSKSKAPSLLTPTRLRGMQVAILGAETAVGQYVALLLKQCPCIKRLRLFEACDNSNCVRRLCHVVEDLRRIDTNCIVQAHYHSAVELERCLQSSDIVLMLDSPSVTSNMPLPERFCIQAPMVKYYVDYIANECPKAFIIIGTSPIECMVPLAALTLQETGWYDPKKLLGSMAVPEMRASTLAAKALGFEPFFTKIPCVGGTEGDTLVPLFSRAVEHFEFAVNNAIIMTETVRNTQEAVVRVENCCARAAELSEAHALSRLVTKVALALLCDDVPKVTGFVENNPKEVISPARFIGSPVKLNVKGILQNLPLPKMNEFETIETFKALGALQKRMCMVCNWYAKYNRNSPSHDESRFIFYNKKAYGRFDDCVYSSV